MRRVPVLVVLLCVFATACSKPAGADAAPPEPTSGPPNEPGPPVPVDHLAPGEIVPGTERALGLLLPRGARVDGVSTDVAYVTTPYPVAALTAYVRVRVREGAQTDSPQGSTFEQVKLPDRPDRTLRIRIEPFGAGSRLEIRDTTPPVAPSFPDNAARWRAVGLDEDGNLLAPKRLQ